MLALCWFRIQPAPVRWKLFDMPSLRQSAGMGFSSWAVSSLGRVRNSRGVVTWGTLRPSGYRAINVPMGHSRKALYVHSGVAFCFHGAPPTPWHVVDHHDGNRQNNREDNLKYLTHAENIRKAYAMRAQIRGEQKGREIMGRPLRGVVWQHFTSIRQAARLTNISESSVSRCASGKLRSCKGWEFRSVDQPDLPEETWASAMCPGQEHPLPSYRVSTHGRIQGPTGIKTYGWADAHGYPSFTFMRKTMKVHRIVACTFVMDINRSDQVVNHKDGNPTNNHFRNLEVVTQKENVQHAWDMRDDRDAVALRRPVEGRLVETQFKLWVTFPSARAAALQLGINSGSICHCCKGRTASAGGYVWRYAPQAEPEAYPGEEWRSLDVAALVAAWTKQQGQNSDSGIYISCALDSTFHFEVARQGCSIYNFDHGKQLEPPEPEKNQSSSKVIEK